jgi:hypothetical protein
MLSFVYTSARIFFPFLVVRLSFYQDIYSDGSLGDCMSELCKFLLSCPHFFGVGSFKFVKPCNPSFGEVLGYLQEGVNNVESERECAVGHDHNTENVLQ